jgi:ABC-2 type transport system ATP-binding protein
VRALCKRYGEYEAVRGIDITVQRGEVFGLLGPNGAGKSTLIRMLTTLVPPTGGTAVVAGHDIIHDPNAVRAGIGVIPQSMTSDPELTCAENLGIHARLYGITGARRRQRTAELLEAVNLSDRADALAATLSGGGCGGGSKLRAGWYTTRKSCFWTNLRQAWTRPRAFRCGR